VGHQAGFTVIFLAELYKQPETRFSTANRKDELHWKCFKIYLLLKWNVQWSTFLRACFPGVLCTSQCAQRQAVLAAVRPSLSFIKQYRDLINYVCLNHQLIRLWLSLLNILFPRFSIVINLFQFVSYLSSSDDSEFPGTLRCAERYQVVGPVC
jgi:hypothetical protein